MLALFKEVAVAYKHANFHLHKVLEGSSLIALAYHIGMVNGGPQYGFSKLGIIVQ